jgi:hypothetical protein
MATTADEDSIENLAAIVRRIVGRELREMDRALFLSDEQVDRLSKLALSMQRLRVPANAGGKAADSEASDVTDEQLMRKAG